MAPTTANEADILQNKLNLLFADRQRLLSTWLPPRTPEEVARSQATAEEIEQEEAATFQPIPTRLGIGAPIPADMVEEELRRRRPTADERLRKRLFGKKNVAATAPGRQAGPMSSTEALSTGESRATKSVSNGDDDDDDDDGDDDGDDDQEESRASLGGRLKQRTTLVASRASRAQENPMSPSEKQQEEEKKGQEDYNATTSTTTTTMTKASKRPHSFLDVMLEKKARKRRGPVAD
ncbi:MAG: hypothetical protein M1816_000603 [Peltula sp. TS41687]|nr:MAG: hypothetical protein M1816_000603 [Peltula sp. TS41687]